MATGRGSEAVAMIELGVEPVMAYLIAAFVVVWGRYLVPIAAERFGRVSGR